MSLTLKLERMLRYPLHPEPRLEWEVRSRLVLALLYHLGYRSCGAPFSVRWMETGTFAEDKQVGMTGWLRPDLAVRTSPNRIVTIEVRNPKYSVSQLEDYTTSRWEATDKSEVNRLITVTDSKLVTVSHKGTLTARNDETGILNFLFSTLRAK